MASVPKHVVTKNPKDNKPTAVTKHVKDKPKPAPANKPAPAPPPGPTDKKIVKAVLEFTGLPERCRVYGPRFPVIVSPQHEAVDIALKAEGSPVLKFLNQTDTLVETVELKDKNRRECRQELISRGFQKVEESEVPLPSPSPLTPPLPPPVSGPAPPTPGTSKSEGE